MPEWLIVTILGLVEGITEFLPVSSTGHLLLMQAWLGSPRSDLFITVIQCGTVLAVIAVFARRTLQLLQSWREAATQNYLLKLAAAFLLTAIGGLLLKVLGIQELPETAEPVAWAVLLGGILMLLIERALRGRPLQDQVSWNAAACIGLAQLAAAVFPGTSRSGANILVALAFGLRRPLATEFSFLLGIPTLLAAGALETFTAYRHSTLAQEDWSMVMLGTAVATLTAFVAVKWLLRYVQSHTFNLFGWYRVVLGLAILLWLGRS